MAEVIGGVGRGVGRGEGGARDRSDHGEGRAGGGQDFLVDNSCHGSLLPGEPRTWQGWGTLGAKTTTKNTRRGSARALLSTIIAVSPHGRIFARKATRRQESYAATGASSIW